MRCVAGRRTATAGRRQRRAAVASTVVAVMAATLAYLASTPVAFAGVGKQSDQVRAIDAAAGSAVLAFGDAPDAGSLAGVGINRPIVGMAGDHTGHGYWLVGSDGGVFSFGDAGFYGSTGGIHLTQPVVGMAPTPTGHGYWLVASDGGIFSFGAGFYGSTGGIHLTQPVVGMAATSTGHGYWLVASDGGIFSFGDAGFFGSAGGRQLVQPVIGMASTPSGHGYWMVEGQKQGSSPFTPALVAALNGRAGLSSATVLNLHNGQVYQYRPGFSMITASIVKVEILGTLLLRAQRAGRGLTPAEQALAVPMIEQSDNNAASALYAAVGGPAAVSAFDRLTGMGSTTPAPAWGFTTTTATDQVTLIDHLAVPNAVLNNGSRGYALNLMEHVTPSQAWGVSAGVAIGVTVALKNGWLPFMNAWTVNSIGWINGGGRDYVIAVLSDDQPTEQYGIDTISQIASASWASLGG